ncbi:MAG: hypothetical protein IAI50_12195, partial [Candidatus Eremiobacteraeota bacterium]|nr:hypothetical protein [Candidatus Eremiobacteraeota bacterium]
VDPHYDLVARRLYLTGRTAGETTVTVSDNAGNNATIAVLVAPAAGVVPSEANVELGGSVSTAFATAQIQTAIARAAQMQPRTTIVVRDVTLPPALRPGDAVDAQARVRIDGQGAFVDQSGMTTVHVHVATLEQLDPAFLFYSDDPERLDSDDDGVLYRNTIDTSRSARVYAYHVSDIPERRLYLALRATGADARVQILGYAAGPTDAFSYAGHVSTLQYLLARGTGESSIALVTRDAPYLLQLGTRALHQGELVAAIYDLRVLSGEPVAVAIVAAGGDAEPIDMLDSAERAGDGHGRRGEFALADVPPLALSYAIGDPEPTPFSIGTPTIPNLRAGGRPLGGDYGVLRGIALELSNPTTAPATAYVYESAAGGTATTTMWFTGDPRPTEIPCVKLPASRYLVREVPLAAGETRTVTGEYMTDGTSSFPLLFGLTATAPSPPPGPSSPDACNPKPLPAPSPEPAPELPAPDASAAPSPPISPTPTVTPTATATPTVSATP